MTYIDLLAKLGPWFERGRAAAGRRPDGTPVVPCRAGCTACCRGPFDISPADAAVVAEGLAGLDGATRAALRERAAAQLARYRALAPGWRPPFDVGGLPEADFDGLVLALEADPCPALGADGGCTVYSHRPATCRMLGLGMVSEELGMLENTCPIQAEHPEYAALAPTPFDLLGFERASERAEEAAAAAGWATTTVAAVLAGFGRWAAADGPEGR